MAKYSIKKCQRRNVKKYKKSRRGCGKRSLRGGKTRKYKVFKNIKRRTLGKRKGKRMVGGRSIPWTFPVNSESLRNYVNTKYGKNFSSLKLVAYGYVAITNRSKKYFFRAEHSVEKIVVFACYNETDTDGHPNCYAIARCNDGLCEQKPYNKINETPNSNMEEKILFLDLGRSNTTKKNIDDGMKNTESKEYKALQDFAEKQGKTIEEFIGDIKKQIKWFEFQSVYSSNGDLYRVFTYPSQKNLVDFFEAVSNNPPQNFTPVDVEYEDLQLPEQQQSSPPPSRSRPRAVGSSAMGGLGFFDILIDALNEAIPVQ